MLETRLDGKAVRRRRQCPCGARWSTAERVIAGTLTTARSDATPLPVVVAPPPTGSDRRPLPVAVSKPPVPPSPPSDPISLFSKPPDPERAIPRAAASARVRTLAPPAYPLDWEAAFWKFTGIGSKAEAFKAWLQVGKPDPEMLATAWRKWQAIAWPDGFGVPHVSTWLRHFDWREEPRPRPRTGKPAERGAPMPPETKPDPKTPPAARGWANGGGR